MTSSSLQAPNVTHVSHVTSKLGSSADTWQTAVQCSAVSNSPSYNRLPQITTQTSDLPPTAYPVTRLVHVAADPPASEPAAATCDLMNSKDIIQHIRTHDNSSGLLDRPSFESPPGISGSDQSRDNSLVISIRQNLSDILHLNQTTFDQTQSNRTAQRPAFNRPSPFEHHCSGILPSSSQHSLPAADDDCRGAEVELHDVVLSPSTLDSSPLLSQSSTGPFQNPPTTMIKSSLKKDSPPQGVRKAVTFSTSDLVHVEEYTISPATPPRDLFLPFDRQLGKISEDGDSVLFGGVCADLWAPETTRGDYHGSWFNSSTDADPYLADFPSPNDDTKDCAPLSIVNDVFGRTTIFLTSGTFRPGDSGKLNGMTVSNLSGSHDQRRTMSTGTLSGIRSHRTLVKVNFIQGLLDINHNPGQTVETDSKAVQDNETGGIVSTLNYCRGIFHENLKNPNIKEFPREEIAAQKRVDQKICHKLSTYMYKYKLIAAAVGAFILLSLVIGLGVGLGH